MQGMDKVLERERMIKGLHIYRMTIICLIEINWQFILICIIYSL